MTMKFTCASRHAVRVVSLLAVLELGVAAAMATLTVAHAAMNDISNFPQPHSRCMQATKGRILTTVGTFPVPRGKVFELVADTQLTTDGMGDTEYQDPSFNVFSDTCELVWRQSYPFLGEVGFQTLNMPTAVMLHVSAISVFEPVDQVITHEELLESDGDSMSTQISFGGSRYGFTYVGPVGADSRFAVVKSYIPHPPSLPIGATIYRWTSFPDQDNPSGPRWYTFAGPEQIDAKELDALKVPFGKGWPAFPLTRFLSGYP
jgi:hypothetical protein